MSEPEIVALAERTYHDAQLCLLAAMEREIAATLARCEMSRRHAAAYVVGGPGLSGDELVASAAVMDAWHRSAVEVNTARDALTEAHIQWLHAVSR